MAGMYKMVGFAIVATLALLMETVTAITLPAGKCKHLNTTLLPLDFNYFEAHKPWRVVYASLPPVDSDLDSVVRDGQRMAYNWYKMVDNIAKKNSSTGTYEFSMDVVNNVLIENTVEENGNKQRFFTYPLAITTDFGLLFYRCSETGEAEVDTRYIWVPANVTLSDAGLRYLMQVDSSYGFRGQLQKLSEEFSSLPVV